MFPKVVIKLNATGMGYVEVDGERLKGNYAVSFESAVGDIARMTVKQFCQEVVIEADAEVTRVVICPSCQKELERWKKAGGPIGTADATTREDMVAPFWKRELPAPPKEGE